MPHEQSARQTLRRGHLNVAMEMFNADQASKVSKSLAEYHQMFIGTPSRESTVHARLWLVERLSVKWWLATFLMWAWAMLQAWRLRRRMWALGLDPDKPCAHEPGELAHERHEPGAVPCPACGMLLIRDHEKT